MMMQTKYDYCSDVFFKYLFGRNEEESLFLRKFFLNALIPFEMSDVFVDNPELIPRFICDRNVILDSYMQKSDIEINIEMQKSLLSRYIYQRFQYYSARLLAGQKKTGDDFHHMKKVYQIIVVEDVDRSNKKLVEVYHAKQHRGEKELPYFLQTTIYIYLPYIETVYKEKDKLSEWEAMIYLMYKGTLEGISYEEEKGVIKQMERMHEEFIGNKELMKATMTRELKRENYKLWHDMDVEDAKQEGLQQGLQQGIDVGKQEQLMELLSFKYPKENHDWVRDCRSDQLIVIGTLIFKDLSYDELKLSVLKKE